MSVDLRFDIGAFSDAAKEYEDIITDMNRIKEELEKELEELKSTNWNSEAGTEFQNQYESTWKKNVETYTDFMQHLINNLVEVESQYSQLYNRAQNISLE